MSERLLRLSSLESDDDELVNRARAGDERAAETLLGRYRTFTRAKARSYFLPGAEGEDIVQEGMIGLFKAIRDFHPGHNVAFRAFAEICITRQIITAIKSSTRQKHRPLNSYVSLHRTSSDDAAESDLLHSLVAPSASDPADLVVSAEELGAIREAIRDVLSALESQVLGLYMEGRSYHEIAEMLGRHVKSIDNALQRIKRKLEQHLRHSG